MRVILDKSLILEVPVFGLINEHYITYNGVEEFEIYPGCGSYDMPETIVSLYFKDSQATLKLKKNVCVEYFKETNELHLFCCHINDTI